jgi:DNA-binding LacI/PurR family transcriptional regulator
VLWHVKSDLAQTAAGRGMQRFVPDLVQQRHGTVEGMNRPSRRPASIEDVARQAGVSLTTVSHALNGKGRVSPETRVRVAEAAKALGYRGSAIARRLASGARGGVLALHVAARDSPTIVSDIEYFTTLMMAAATTALSHGYWLALAPVSATVDIWNSLPTDGVIIVDPLIDDPLVRAFGDRNVPVVTVGRAALEVDCDGGWVDNDHNAGTRAILEHLRSQGAASIALIVGPEMNSYTADARNAYAAWAAAQGAEPRIYTAGSGLSEDAGYEATVKMFADDWRPDAIYATVDRLALGSLRAIKDQGLSVPEDILLAGLSDSESARSSRPPLTVLALHPDLAGQCAAEMLIALVEGGRIGSRHRLIPAEVVPRRSTDISDRDHRRLARRKLTP